MTNFTMRVAGRVVAVAAMFDATRSYCGAFLCDDAPDFAVAITPADIAFERERRGLPEQEKNALLGAFERSKNMALFAVHTTNSALHVIGGLA